MIIRGGHNIDPATIEEPLNRHPDVLSAIAVGMPDPYAGKLPMVYAVGLPDTTVTAAELLAYCETEVWERTAIPKRIEIIATMPITTVAKIFRPLLREHLQRRGIDAEISGVADNKLGMTAIIKLTDFRNTAKASELLSNYNIVASYQN